MSRINKIFISVFIFLLLNSFLLHAQYQALEIGAKHYGLCIGNSKNFNGIRVNISDRAVGRINGFNVTLWRAYVIKNSQINGIGVGLIGPRANRLSGIMIGGIGVSAEAELNGIAVSLLGAGAGANFSGIGIGGLGVGAGNDFRGVVIGGLGAGAGTNFTGVGIGGLGVGAGQNVKGMIIGGLGVGAGENFTGIAVGGLGGGAGKNFTGIGVGGLGIGAGETARGLLLGGLGVAASQSLKGLAVSFGVVGSSELNGIMMSGLAIRAEKSRSISITPGWHKIREGYFKGIAIAGFNDLDVPVTGVQIGLVNLAGKLKGFQLGLLNIVKSNPVPLRYLPLLNLSW